MRKYKYITEEGKFFVEIEEPSKEQIASYYEKTGEIPSSNNKIDAPRVYKKCKILYTCDALNYPTGSIWIMGESPGVTINFFGEKIIEIQKKDLHARIH